MQIFLGALIMRHTAHVKLKKFKLTFNMLATVDSQTKLNDFSTDEHLDDSSKALNDEDCVLYALRVAQLQAKVQKFLEHGSRKCYSRPELSSQIDSNPSSANYDRLHHNIVRAIFGKAIAKNAAETKDRNDAFRIYVDEMYKEFFFHHNYTQSLEMPQTLRCIYPTLALIDHSCDPNCFVVYELHVFRIWSAGVQNYVYKFQNPSTGHCYCEGIAANRSRRKFDHLLWRTL